MPTKDRQPYVIPDAIAAKLAVLPQKPGVYLYRDVKGEIIYVGKAIRLKSRVQSYFRNDPKATPKTVVLVRNIADIDYVVVNNELEALILENNLIKEHRPKYNIRMKDDKNYLYLKVTREDFPQVLLVRRMVKDGARYFGPYTSASAIRYSLSLAEKLFAYRKCEHEFSDEDGKPRNPRGIRPCVQYQIGRCIGICKPEITKAEHDQIISLVIDFFSGRGREIVRSLETSMQNAASDMQFEKAAAIRDQINQIKTILEKQHTVQTDQMDRDVFGLSIVGSSACVHLFRVRQGLLLGREEFSLDSGGDCEPEEVLRRAIAAYYEKAFEIPKEILVPVDLEDAATLEQWLDTMRLQLPEQENSRLKTTLVRPLIGEKKSIVDLASKNAEQRLLEMIGQWKSQQQRSAAGLSEIKEALELPRKPERIECYDISHLGGEGTVGSMVVYVNGEPKKEDYRKFKLKTVQGGDDFAALQEVLERRFKHLGGVAIGVEGLSLRQATPKAMKFIEQKLIEEQLDSGTLASEQFLVLRYNGEIVGFGRVKEYGDQRSKEATKQGNNESMDQENKESKEILYELGSLWVQKDLRGRKFGYMIMSELLQRTKARVIYLMCREAMAGYYAGFGFLQIETMPEALQEKKDRVCSSFGPIAVMRYDKSIRKKEDLSFTALPDLVLIDGGKGQLSSSVEILEKMGLIRAPQIIKAAFKGEPRQGREAKDQKSKGSKKKKKSKAPEKKPKIWERFVFPIASLAKQEEEVFLPWQAQPAILPPDKAGGLLLRALRDEAHRFAVSYQRKVRGKAFLEDA